MSAHWKEKEGGPSAPRVEHRYYANGWIKKNLEYFD